MAVCRGAACMAVLVVERECRAGSAPGVGLSRVCAWCGASGTAPVWRPAVAALAVPVRVSIRYESHPEGGGEGEGAGDAWEWRSLLVPGLIHACQFRGTGAGRASDAQDAKADTAVMRVLRVLRQ